MSNKQSPLVRKLLQVTSTNFVDGYSTSISALPVVPAPAASSRLAQTPFVRSTGTPFDQKNDGTIAPKRKLVGRRKSTKSTEVMVMNPEQVVQRYIRSMLMFQGTVDKYAGGGGCNSTRRTDASQEHKKSSLKKKQGKRNIPIIAASRSRASQVLQRPEPTFNKKRYQIESKQNQLRKIARMLKSESSKA